MDDQEREIQEKDPQPEDNTPAEVEYEAHLDDEFSEPEEYTHPPDERRPGPDQSALEALRRERDEMAQKYEQVEPYLNILHRPDFREWLEERAALGDEAVPREPAPEPQDIIEFQRNALSPEFPVIQEMMRAWAATLPEFQRQELDSNHKAFNRAFRAFREAGGDQLPYSNPPASPPAANVPTPPRDRASIEAAIRLKEINKVLARVEPPGAAHYEVPEDPAAPYKKARARLYQARENGTPAEAAAAELRMIETYFSGEDAPKKLRSKSW